MSEPSKPPDPSPSKKTQRLQLERRNLEVPASERVLLLRYLRAVWEDAVARMGGGLGIVLAFLAAYFAFVAGHNVALLWVLALMAFLFASYRVWAKERRALLAEQTKNANPDIQGEIKEVYFEHAVDVNESGPNKDGQYEVFYDYIFTIRVFIKNLGVKTTIETYRLILTADGMTRNGERITLDDHYFRKPGIADARINDIEHRNDPASGVQQGWMVALCD